MEHAHTTREITVPFPEGTLEALLTVPVHEFSKGQGAAVICHPHPLYGGTMHSKVVVAAAHTLLELGIPSLRFNFRGVGKSSGTFDYGRGEGDDLRAALAYMVQAYPQEKIIVAGFSFGAWIGMREGCRSPKVHLIMGIGTPAQFGSEYFPTNCIKTRLFIHGMLDRIIPLESIEALYSKLPEPKKLVKIEGADHFFTGKLDELSHAVRSLVREYVPVG